MAFQEICLRCGGLYTAYGVGPRLMGRCYNCGYTSYIGPATVDLVLVFRDGDDFGGTVEKGIPEREVMQTVRAFVRRHGEDFDHAHYEDAEGRYVRIGHDEAMRDFYAHEGAEE